MVCALSHKGKRVCCRMLRVRHRMYANAQTRDPAPRKLPTGEWSVAPMVVRHHAASNTLRMPYPAVV